MCTHSVEAALEMKIPQSLSGTSCQLSKFLPASNLSFSFIYLFFKVIASCHRVKKKGILSYIPCTCFSGFLFSSLAQLTTSRWNQYIPPERDWNEPPCFCLPLLGKSPF